MLPSVEPASSAPSDQSSLGLPQRRQWLLWAAASLLLGRQAPANPAGTAVRRIICAGGALTETVHLLGAGAELVAVDTTSQYPPSVRQLLSVGYVRALSAEGMLALRPSLVLSTEDAGPAAVLRQVAAAGVQVAVLPAEESFAAMLGRCRQVAQLIGRDAQAGPLLARLQQEWAQLQHGRVPVASRAPRVLFVLSHVPGQIMVGGRDTGIERVIAYAGGVNAVDGFSGYKPLTPEAVIAAQPDVLLLTDRSIRVLGSVAQALQLPGLQHTPAGRSRRALVFEANYLLGFGPRLPALVRELRRDLQGASA